MLVKLDSDNHITIDPSQGCRVQQLTLGGKKIIQFIEKESFLGSGSYLMFPWVNRVVQNPYQQIAKHQFTDGKGYPLHGLYADTKRQVKTQQKGEGNNSSIQISISHQENNPKIHGFREIFTLSHNTLEISFEVIESKKDPNPYCFGYHPYFEMSKPLSKIKISSNLTKQLKLQEDLLVKWPKEQKQWSGKIDGKEKYDSLFQGTEPYTEDKLGNFVELNDGLNRLRVESNLEYWQIYTPEDGKRIAIEPMSFHGNLYQICKQNPEILKNLPKSGKIRICVQ